MLKRLRIVIVAFICMDAFGVPDGHNQVLAGSRVIAKSDETTILTGHLAGSEVIKIPDDVTNASIEINNIDGANRAIEISGKRINRIRVVNPRLSELDISFEDAGVIEVGGAGKIDTLNITSGSKIGSLVIGPYTQFSEIHIAVSVVGHLTIVNPHVSNLTLHGMEDLRAQITPHIEDSSMRFLYGESNMAIAIEKLRFDGFELIRPLAIDERLKFSSSFQLRIADCEVRRRMALDLGNSKVTELSIRNIAFNGHAYFQVTHDKKDAQIDSFVLSNISEPRQISIQLLKTPRVLVMRNVSAQKLRFQAAYGETNDREVNIGLIKVQHGLEGSGEFLLGLAKNNQANDLNERLDFVQELIDKGHFRSRDGGLSNERMKAIEVKQMLELDDKPIGQRVFGYVVYFLTGFGVTVTIPLVTWILSVVICGFVYASTLTTNFRWSHMPSAIITSGLFSLSFGFPSNTLIDKRFHDLGHEPRNGSVIQEWVITALPHIQGVISLFQLTLLSIYFGHTVLS